MEILGVLGSPGSNSGLQYVFADDAELKIAAWLLEDRLWLMGMADLSL
jgi:hypothetical protein